MEELLALALLVVCLAMLVRMALPGHARRGLDAAGRQAWDALRSLPHWRQRRQHQREADAQAQAAIERARQRRASGAGPRKLH